MASRVQTDWLAEIAPQLVTVETGIDPYYDPEADVVMSTSRTSFNGHVVSEEVEADGDHPEAAELFAAWVASQVLAA